MLIELALDAESIAPLIIIIVSMKICSNLTLNYKRISASSKEFTL
jgi:hypothetical protein